MDRAAQYEKHKEYIVAEGLDKLLDFRADLDYERGAFDSVSGNLDIPYPPETDDLVRLHKLIRSRRPFTVMEFGLGYSTLIFAHALAANERDWNALPEKPEIRNRFPFQLFSVDTSEKWLEVTKSRFPAELVDRVHFHHSQVAIGTHNGQLCHFYENLPDIVPQFIYVDGPHVKHVKGSINGLSFQCPERTVMSGDLLLMEPTFLPGTYILFDGRTNNARFVARNLTRNYEIHHDPDGDVTHFELIEERLGRYNVLGSDFF